MPLPVTISNVAVSIGPSFFGPFKNESSGNFYTVLLDSLDKSVIEAWKATDPTSSFSEVGSAGKPDLTNNVNSYYVEQDGDILHIATQEASTGRVSYHTFNMSSDSWGTVNEQVVASVNSPLANHMCVSIKLRSDGDIIVLYHGGRENIAGTNYGRVHCARKESGSWTVGVQVDSGGAVSWVSGFMVKGSGDRMHLFFKNDTTIGAYQRCLRSDNSLESFPSSFQTGTAGIDRAFQNGVSYVSGSDTLVRVPFAVSTKFSVAKFVSADTPSVTVDADVSEDVEFINNYFVGCLAKNSALYLLYADAATEDLWLKSSDTGWAGGVKILDGVTINMISSNVYIREGKSKIAFVYDDLGTISYSETTHPFNPALLRRRVYIFKRPFSFGRSLGG